MHRKGEYCLSIVTFKTWLDSQFIQFYEFIGFDFPFVQEPVTASLEVEAEAYLAERDDVELDDTALQQVAGGTCYNESTRNSSPGHCPGRCPHR